MGSADGTHDADVLVAGGGIAGVAAAVSAARAGARTLLVEQGGRLGGIGTRGMLRTICGLYGTGRHGDPETLNAGLAREVESLMRERTPGRAPTRIGKVIVLQYVSADLEQVLEDLCAGEGLLTVMREAAAAGVDAGGGAIRGVAVGHAGARRTIRPRAVVDCTGDGAVSCMAGAAFDLSGPDEVQLAGFTVQVRGLSGGDEALSLKVPFVLAEAVQQGLLPSPIRFTKFSAGDGQGEGYLKFSAEGSNGPERDRRTQAAVADALRVLAERLPAFRSAVVSATSGSVLDREGRRIRGTYVLTAEDVLGAKKFPDGVVKNAWPIELWDPADGPQYRYVPDGDWYEIPFRCLAVEGFANLLVAGRCISATREALGSTRVMGACIALGEAAGKAAAAFARDGKYPAAVQAGK